VKCGVNNYLQGKVFLLKSSLTEIVKRKGVYADVLKKISFSDYEPSIIHVDQNKCVSKKEIDFHYAPFGFSSLKYRTASSSGTSGTPFRFPQPINAIQREQAYIDKVWSLVGFDISSRLSVLRGGAVPCGVQSIGRRQYLYIHDWSDDQIRVVMNALNSYNPHYIHCYPSILERLVRKAAKLGLEFPSSIRGVLAGSEATSDAQRNLFVNLLGCDVISWYGQSEQVVLAVREPDGCYAVVPGYSDVAFLESNGRKGRYQIVGKSFCNPLFSHNWYLTGDYCAGVSLGYSYVLKCKTILINDLSGRDPVNIITNDGDLVPFNHVVFGLHDVQWEGIDRWCFIQEKPGVLLFVFSGKGIVESRDLVALLRKRLPEGVQLKALYKSEIDAVSKIKWRYFFSDEKDFYSFSGINLSK